MDENHSGYKESKAMSKLANTSYVICFVLHLIDCYYGPPHKNAQGDLEIENLKDEGCNDDH